MHYMRKAEKGLPERYVGHAPLTSSAALAKAGAEVRWQEIEHATLLQLTNIRVVMYGATRAVYLTPSTKRNAPFGVSQRDAPPRPRRMHRRDTAYRPAACDRHATIALGIPTARCTREAPGKRDLNAMKQSEDRLDAAPQAHDPRPVGVFDSGVGGLTILNDLLRELPAERFVYFGDTGNCPYGTRTETAIQQLSCNVARFLLSRDVKLIVVACNTASVSALAALRRHFDIHFVGVVPAVKPAAERTRAGRVGVVATEASARGGYLKRLIADHANGVEVLAAGCPQLVTLVERGILDGPEAEAAILAYVRPMLDAGIDELVLGCTHFPAMRAAFERICGPSVEVIDSGAAIARQARRVLTAQGRLADPAALAANAPRSPRPDDEFWCSGDLAVFERTATAILGQSVPVHVAPNFQRIPASA